MTGSLQAGAEGGLETSTRDRRIALGRTWRCLESRWLWRARGAYAIVGATAFLGVSMKTPITAVFLTLELTQLR
ncbi:chloride channel protein [Bradyrhizobium vignae]|uniref:chloride channel protein n=1 Tax=Bradyrhizobium vignae TaxID=1549949 RepID=UPI001ABF97E9